MTEPLVLGIETSCDETGVGIVRGHTLLADALASSVDEHARFGGVVPEVASRAHLEAMVPTMQRALDRRRRHARRRRRDRGDRRARAWPARCWSGSPPPRGTRSPRTSRCTASTTSPRTWRSTRWSTARCRSRRSRCWSPAATRRCCWSTTSPHGVTPLGATIDDAAGEAFDKVARLLGLPFPGGPPIDRAAREGDRRAIAVPARPDRAARTRRAHRFDFSFSGLKTAVARWVEARERAGEPVPVADVAASFQEAVCDVLTAKAIDACRAARRRHAGDRRRRGGQLAAAGDGRGAVREARHRRAGAPAQAVHRQRRDGRGAGLPPGRGRRAGRAGWICRPTPRCR